MTTLIMSKHAIISAIINNKEHYGNKDACIMYNAKIDKFNVADDFFGDKNWASIYDFSLLMPGSDIAPIDLYSNISYEQIESRLSFSMPEVDIKWVNISPVELKIMRESLDLTQSAAAKLIFSKLVTWQKWEYSKNNMTSQAYALFLILSKWGQKSL